MTTTHPHSPAGPHCECCGALDPRTDDGYTLCCNELVCHGDYEATWGNDERSVRACCGYVVEVKFGDDMPETFWRIG